MDDAVSGVAARLGYRGDNDLWSVGLVLHEEQPVSDGHRRGLERRWYGLGQSAAGPVETGWRRASDCLVGGLGGRRADQLP